MDPISEVTTPAAKPAAKATKVAKYFHTHNRRFNPGDEVRAQDLAGSALDFEHLKKRGFIVAA